jgi:hypothetical protein
MIVKDVTKSGSDQQQGDWEQCGGIWLGISDHAGATSITVHIPE